MFKIAWNGKKIGLKSILDFGQNEVDTNFGKKLKMFKIAWNGKKTKQAEAELGQAQFQLS